jgi:uncharacterized protein YjiS (DUF1127 family)
MERHLAMQRIVIKARTLSAAGALNTKRRRANDNGPAEAVQGEFTPISFRNGVVVRRPRSARAASGPAANSNQPGDHHAGWAAELWHCVAQLWAAFRRERAIARAEAKLSSLSDRELHDIGIKRGSIAFAVRHGRDLKASQRRDR